MPNAEILSKLEPQLIADAWLYPSDGGGRQHPISPGWGCPCFPQDGTSSSGWDAWPLLGSEPMQPGERRRLGFVFVSGDEAVKVISSAGRFLLWEFRYIGEAEVI
jgi:hypothetical protein